MDDPNITMEEYIRLEEEKAQKRGKVFNWETAKYGKIWYDEDVHTLRSVETEFPAIVFNDNLTSNETLSCKPTVSSLNNNEIDFRISFDESNDEDYTVIFDKNSFSYKIISVNDLKTDSENDNDKVNMPLFPSPEHIVSYFNDLDFFKDFKNEFSAIVYNDALTSKLDFLTKPTVSPQHIDKYNLRDETSLSECDEEEQNILYFNDLFPFNVIYPDDSKLDKDNDDDKINIKHSSGVIIEYLVKISKKARILELKRRHLKITVLTSNTPYPSRKIRRICACTSLKTTKEQDPIRPIQRRPIRRIQVMEKIFWKISNFILVYVLLYATYHSTGSSDTDQIVSLVGPAGDPWDQRVPSQLIGKDLVSGLLVYELPLSSLRKKYRLSLKNDMPHRDK
ncbi:hypothetical protein Tco_0336384 [Tanacetum coccineum]